MDGLYLSRVLFQTICAKVQYVIYYCLVARVVCLEVTAFHMKAQHVTILFFWITDKKSEPAPLTCAVNNMTAGDVMSILMASHLEEKRIRKKVCKEVGNWCYIYQFLASLSAQVKHLLVGVKSKRSC